MRQFLIELIAQQAGLSSKDLWVKKYQNSASIKFIVAEEETRNNNMMLWLKFESL